MRFGPLVRAAALALALLPPSRALAERPAPADAFLFESAYRNLVLAGRTAAGDMALVAGTHGRSFPYVGTAPWDNGLLWIGDRGYHFTGRTNGEHLRIRADLEAGPGAFAIEYVGPMTRAGDGEPVHVEIRIAGTLAPEPARQLGRLSEWLARHPGAADGARRIDDPGSLGMRWRPAALRGSGTVAVAGAVTAVRAVCGELEEGRTRSFAARPLAFAYDYMALAAPGPDGYAFVDFVSHALDPRGLAGRALDAFVSRTASASLTLGAGPQAGNPHGVRRPAAADASVVLFENRVELSLASLRRQMIRSRDASGRPLYGLREIFERR